MWYADISCDNKIQIVFYGNTFLDVIKNSYAPKNNVGNLELATSLEEHPMIYSRPNTAKKIGGYANNKAKQIIQQVENEKVAEQIVNVVIDIE